MNIVRAALAGVVAFVAAVIVNGGSSHQLLASLGVGVLVTVVVWGVIAAIERRGRILQARDPQ